MDDNTTKVVLSVIALVSAIVTPFVLVIVTRMQNKKIEGYHNEVNGKMSKLLQTTADLATAKEKAKNK